jgi:hypothetical protein
LVQQFVQNSIPRNVFFTVSTEIGLQSDHYLGTCLKGDGRVVVPLSEHVVANSIETMRDVVHPVH